MNPMLQNFLAVALPIIVTFIAVIWLASHSQNKTMWLAAQSQNKRLDDIIARLDRIETKLENHGDRITRLEERTPPLVRVS